MKEIEIQRQIMEWLDWMKVFHYRQNTGAFATKTGGFVRFGATGSPDIICVVDGQFIGIEVKAKGGKQSPAQKEFQGRLVLAGGKYILAYDLDDVIKSFKK